MLLSSLSIMLSLAVAANADGVTAISNSDAIVIQGGTVVVGKTTTVTGNNINLNTITDSASATGVEKTSSSKGVAVNNVPFAISGVLLGLSVLVL